MAISGKTSRTISPYLVLAIAIPLICIALFSLDKDIKHPGDLLTAELIPVTLFYATPIFLLCSILLRRLLRKYDTGTAILISLAAGITLGFLSVVLLLYLSRYIGLV